MSSNCEIQSQISSMRVMFSDRGSVLFGIILTALMIILSATFFTLRLQQKKIFTSESKIKKTLYEPLILKNKKVMALPLKPHYLLLFRSPNKISLQRSTKTLHCPNKTPFAL